MTEVFARYGHETKYREERSPIGKRILAIEGACSCGWTTRREVRHHDDLADEEMAVVQDTVAHRNGPS